MSNDSILRHLEQRVPEFEVEGTPERLGGGLVNHVWRVPGAPSPVIVKFAQPYVATVPEISLDTGRIIIEGRSLAAFEEDGSLAGLDDPRIRPPRLIDLDEERCIIVMEDVGASPDLGAWLRQCPEGTESCAEVGRTIGSFIAALHRHTYDDQRQAAVFNNAAVQNARLEGQYCRIKELCVRAGLPDSDVLGAEAERFGALLRQPGRCVIMGDLWPPSLLISDGGIRVIDWEFAHFGRPAQDVAHLVAHLWMHTHRAPSDVVAARAQSVLRGFMEEYRSVLDSDFGALFGADGLRECGIHFGAEVLVRSVGAFKDGYLYDGLSVANSNVKEAVEVASAHLRASASVDAFALLRTY